MARFCLFVTFFFFFSRNKRNNGAKNNVGHDRYFRFENCIPSRLRSLVITPYSTINANKCEQQMTFENKKKKKITHILLGVNQFMRRE